MKRSAIQAPEGIELALQKGESWVFDFIFDHYYGPLCAYAKRMTECSETAEDIVQELIAKIWEKREQLQIDSLAKYLFTSVHNSCLNYHQHMKVRTAVHKALLQQVHVSVENLYFEESFKQKLYAAIRQLPPQCQEAFRLSRFEGLKQEEIAQRMGISIKTVKNHIGKALAVLRESVKDSTSILL